MSLALSLILPREAALLTAALAPYFAEVAPAAGIDPAERARQMLHRRDVTAFWIRGGGVRIGFAAVLNLPDDRRELSELCILPRHRRQGWGQQAAQAILAEFPGRWRMGISTTSREAAAFWGHLPQRDARHPRAARGRALHHPPGQELHLRHFRSA